MRFATLPNGTPDGRLHLVSRDNSRCTPCQSTATLQEALDEGEAKTPFMSFGDDVRMECVAAEGSPIFGAIAQQMVKA